MTHRTTPLSAPVVTLACLLPALVQAQREPSGLHFGALYEGYYEVVYVKPPVPPARHLVFAGEPVELQLTFGNPSPTAEGLTIGELPVAQAFQLTTRRLPEGATPPVLLVRPTGRVKAVQLNQDITWGADVAIPGGGTFVLSASIATAPSTAPGLYELEITPRIPSTSKVIPVTSILRYEVRTPSTEAEQIEVLRRHMMRLYNHERRVEAEAAVDQLLSRYPRSAAAYQFKAQLAWEKGRDKEAIDALGRARDLLATGQDELWLAQNTADSTRREIDAVSNRIVAIDKKLPVQVH